MAYLQYDLDHNKNLTMSELNMLISELYTARVTGNPQVARVLKSLRTVAEREERLRVERQILRAKTRMQRAQNNKDGSKIGLTEVYNPEDDNDSNLGVAITPKVFMSFLAKNKMLVKPLQELQFKLRNKYCGPPFWDNEAKAARIKLLEKKCGMPPNVGSMDKLEALRSFLARFQKDMVTAGRVFVVPDDDSDDDDVKPKAGEQKTDESAPAATTNGPATKVGNKGTFVTVDSDSDDSDDVEDVTEGRMGGRRRKKNVKVGVGGSVL